MQRLCVAMLGAALVAGCAAPGAPSDAAVTALAAELPRHRIVLLGEVHDNPAHHRLRHAALKAALDADPGYRPAILMEQFDREHQDAIDAARRERPRDASHVIARATGRPARSGRAGWNWDHYRPFVQLALDHDLPLVAANVSRADLMEVAGKGFGVVLSTDELVRTGLDRPVPADIQKAQEGEIASGHCNALPASAMAPMARAQIARDAYMALRLAQYADRGAVLIAGNGHVRADIGVPRWLPAGTSAHSVGLVESTSGTKREHTGFARTIVTAAVDRPDPCEAFTRARTRVPTPALAP